MDEPNLQQKETIAKAAALDGKFRNLGSDRAIVLDVLRLAKKVPSFPVEKWFDLGEVAKARQNAPVRISWVTLFARAYGLASRDVPELRRTFVAFPWPHFYQSKECVLSVAINRKIDDRDRLFFGRVHSPDQTSLIHIQSRLNDLQTGDVMQQFRQQVIGSRLPSILRRIGWWYRFLLPSRRSKRLGTGSISVLASEGVLNRGHPNMLTSSLTYGPLQEDGLAWTTLICDHRLIDGMCAARALNLLEEYLNGTILSELRQMRTTASHADASKAA